MVPFPAMNNAITIGVDPGLQGAIAFLNADGRLVAVHDFPLSYDGALAWIDGGGLYEVIGQTLAAIPVERDQPVVAWVERVGAMPLQGRTSIFTFGLATGSVLAVLQMHKIAIELVVPVKWKKAFALQGEPKDTALAKCRLLYPGNEWFAKKGHIDRAEATLIARYGRKQGIGRTEKRGDPDLVDIAAV